MLDTPRTPAALVSSKHSLCCSPVVWLGFVVLSALPGVQFHLLYLIFFFYLSTHQMHEASSSPERKECIIKKETARKHSNSPLTPTAHCTIHNLSQAYPGWRTVRTERRRNSVLKRCEELSEVLASTFVFKATTWYMYCTVYFSPQFLFLSERVWFHPHLFQQLQHARDCDNVKQRLTQGQIPARGARASRVHRFRTRGHAARLYSESFVLCGIFLHHLKWTSSKSKLQLRAHGGQWGERERSAYRSVRMVSAAKEEGHQGQNDTLWTDDRDLSVGQLGSTRGMDDLIQEGAGLPGLTYNMLRNMVLSEWMGIAEHKQTRPGLGFVFWKCNN